MCSSNPMTLRSLDDKYGGQREMIIAFLHGETTAEESDFMRSHLNPHSVAIVGISELMKVTGQMADEIEELKRRMDAKG